MIQFIIALGPAQIAALRYIAATEHMTIHQRIASDMDSGRHFLNGVRRLQAEKLVLWHASGKPDPAFASGDGPHWTITEKGKLVLQLIDLEIRDHQELVAQILAPTKAIKAPKRRRKK